MKLIDKLFLGLLATGAVLLFISVNRKPTELGHVPVVQATQQPAPTSSPQPTKSPQEQVVTQGTAETIQKDSKTVQEPTEEFKRDSWIAKELGNTPEEINAFIAARDNQTYSSNYSQVNNSYRKERGSGRVREQKINTYQASAGASMPQPEEPWNEYFYRSATDPVWSFGDDEVAYASAYGLPDQTTDEGAYRCNFGICSLGYHWAPDPGSKPINNPDPTRNARRIKAVARFFGGVADKDIYNNEF